MRREDYIWVGMRIFGIYLVVLAITNLPQFLVGIYMLSGSLGHLTPPTTGAGGTQMAQLQHLTSTLLANSSVTSILKTIIYSAAGWYMLCRGGYLFRLVGSQNPLSDEPARADEESAD